MYSMLIKWSHRSVDLSDSVDLNLAPPSIHTPTPVLLHGCLRVRVVQYVSGLGTPGLYPTLFVHSPSRLKMAVKMDCLLRQVPTDITICSRSTERRLMLLMVGRRVQIRTFVGKKIQTQCPVV